jgi:ankyrin repeat protein
MEQWISLLKSNDYLGIKKYLSNGGNPNAQEDNGESVICFAMRYRCDPEILELLIENGADIHHVDKEGVSVFDVAVTYNNLSIINLLLESGFDVNVPTRKSGFTPLMGAVCYGRIEVVKKLLEKNADIVVRDNHGFSALDYARKMNKKSIFALLQEEMNGTD